MFGITLLAFVIFQRLTELVYANSNTRRLLANGGIEHEASHYYLLVAVHAGWLATLLWLAPGQRVNLWFFLGYIGLQFFRSWIFISLGRRWTTRIITVPGETLVKKGPYKYFRHPNYMLVVAEIACLPLVFGLWKVAITFSMANAVALFIRIRAEEKALAPLRV
jgi:methyltransferase